METAHTPGPWESSKLFSNVFAVGPVIEICTLDVNENNNDFDYEQYKANAKLIAAAPDLLASVKGMLESLTLVMKEMPECTAKGVCLGYFHGEYNKALDAIKKATE